MLDKVSVGKAKRVRGQILNTLYDTRPTPVEMKTVSSVLLDAGYITVPDIKVPVDYLHGKGYLAIISKEEAAGVLKGIIPTDAFLKITPRGVDLVEGTIEDPGVDA